FHNMDAWDKNYYDIADGKYHLKEFIESGKKLFGGDDVVCVWPTWPTLGLDQRNQFNLFEDLPGGLPAMKKQAEISRTLGTKFFICYNPWDEGTDKENHYDGLSYLIKGTTADGVVLDTKAEAGKAIQNSADRVRKGVIMYSEGMAVPKDMTGIVAGRVHNALYYPPMLNLNKLIKPEFTIYRVTEINKEKIQREYATSFFNGYGTEINIMSAGKPDWVDGQYQYLGRTSRILRENSENFVHKGYTPLIPTTCDSIWANKWAYLDKTIYTVYSIIPQGYKGYLFEVQPQRGKHFVDLWHHKLLQPCNINNKWLIGAEADGFNVFDLGTNNEGNVDCIAQLPEILSASIDGDQINITTTQTQGEIRLWMGHPDYAKEPMKLKAVNQTLSMHRNFGRFEGDFIVQYFEGNVLKDETIVTLPAGRPRRISIVQKTIIAKSAPFRMTKVPAGKYTFKSTWGDEFIRYPDQDEGKTFIMPPFWMDIYPVTNSDFKKFM
ncbi:MAG: sulfatase-modifying factor protein, partial [Bacteroidetes bacterium]|nr:sulfatase-modifying factor protein [Bacteroidota bacterium]